MRIRCIVAMSSFDLHIISIHVLPFRIDFGAVVALAAVLVMVSTTVVVVVLPVVVMPVVVIGRRGVIFQKKCISHISRAGIVVVHRGIVKVIVIDTALHRRRIGDPLDGIRHVGLIRRIVSILVVLFFVLLLLFCRGVGGIERLDFFAMGCDPSVHFPGPRIVHALEVGGLLGVIVRVGRSVWICRCTVTFFPGL